MKCRTPLCCSLAPPLPGTCYQMKKSPSWKPCFRIQFTWSLAMATLHSFRLIDGLMGSRWSMWPLVYVLQLVPELEK